MAHEDYAHVQLFEVIRIDGKNAGFGSLAFLTTLHALHRLSDGVVMVTDVGPVSVGQL